jgi:hypothetical protein
MLMLFDKTEQYEIYCAFSGFILGNVSYEAGTQIKIKR